MNARRGPALTTAATPEGRTLCPIRINVECFAVPGDALGLDLEFLRIAVAVPVDGNRGADGNRAFLESCFAGACRWGKCEVPYLAFVVFDLHCRVRSGKANAGCHRTRHFEFLILIAGPSVMGENGNCKNDESKDTRTCNEQKS